MSLNDRKIKILQAIINDYIQTAEPVGSRTIAKKYNLGISSATIRNEMSDLEEMGFIVQPHTSSGRIPSDMGYRLYVDSLMQRRELDESEIGFLNNMINKNIGRIEYLMDETAKMLSAMTNYTTIFSEPVMSSTKIKKINLMSLDDKKLMVLIACDGNVVKSEVIEVNYMPDDDRLYEISRIISYHLGGQIMESLDESAVAKLREDLSYYDGIVTAVLSVIAATVNKGQKTQYHLSGTNNILAYPEFSDVEKAKTLFQTLEQKDALTNLLSDKSKSKGDVQIYIGNESGIEEMKDCSIITTTYKFGNNITGTIGILGPTRMDYSQVVSVLNGMVKNIENVLDGLEKKGDT